MAEFLALRETFGLVADLRMGFHYRGKALAETLAFVRAQGVGLVEAFFELESKGSDRFAKFKKVPFGLTNELDEDATLTATASAKASHDFFEFLAESLDVGGQPAVSQLTLP